MSAQGYQRHNLKRVSIGFDGDTFEQVKSLAKCCNCSFAEAVRILTTWGFESLKEATIAR